MRFLVDARSLADPHAGGVCRVARALVDAFVNVASDDEIILATTGVGTIHELPLRGTNIRHIHIRIPNKLWSAACMAGLTSLDRAIEKRVGKIDAVFLPNIGFTGRSILRPYTLLLHDLSFLIEPRWFPRKMQWWHRAVRAEHLIRNATHLLAVSETTKRDAVRLLGIAPEKISVIPIGPTLNAGAQFIAHTQNRYVLALGGNDPRKNVGTAMAAVEILRREKQFADVELVIVGAPLVGARSERAGARPAPTDSELASLYANASAFLYPSWYEGYGLPLHEAAAYGTPCIASSTGALPETAPRGTMFADPAKPHHWVEALRLTLSQPRPQPIMPDNDAWQNSAQILLQRLTQPFTQC